MKLPVGITPFITKLVIHPDAKVAIARSDSSREGRVIYTISIYSLLSTEQVAKAAPHGIKWMQLYKVRTRRYLEQLIR